MKLLGVSLLAGLALTAASIVVPSIGSSPSKRLTPSPLNGLGVGTQEAEIGQPSPYEVGHCGLIHVVEFDGSFWDVDPPTLTDDENSHFGINSDMGTVTLVNRDVAIYRSSPGRRSNSSPPRWR